MNYIEPEYFNRDNLDINQNKNNLFYYIVYDYGYLNFSLNIKTDWVPYNTYIDLENALNKKLLSIILEIQTKFKEKFNSDIELDKKVKWFNNKKIIKYNSRKFVNLSKKSIKEIDYLDYVKPNDNYQARYILTPIIKYKDSKYSFIFKINNMEIKYKNSHVDSIIDYKEHVVINNNNVNDVNI